MPAVKTVFCGGVFCVIFVYEASGTQTVAGGRPQMVGLGTLGLGGCCPKGRKRALNTRLGLILSPDGD